MTPSHRGLWLMPGLNERLAELHALDGVDHMTMSEIAKTLSIEFGLELSKNAVIGRSYRLKLELRDNVPFTRKQVEKKMRPRRVDAPIPPPEPTVTPADETLTIYQLAEGDCHWPLGEMTDRPPFRYCGQASLFGRPNCKGHSRVACNVPRVEWA